MRSVCICLCIIHYSAGSEESCESQPATAVREQMSPAGGKRRRMGRGG